MDRGKRRQRISQLSYHTLCSTCVDTGVDVGWWWSTGVVMALGSVVTIGAMMGAVMGWGMGTGVWAKYVKIFFVMH